MRAVHIYPTYVRSLAEGITRNVHDLCQGFEDTRIEAVVDAPRVDLDDLNTHALHLAKGWEAQHRARRALEDPDVDVVHYHVGPPVMGLMARLAAARTSTSTPLVLHVWNAVYEPRHVHGDVDWRARWTHRLLNGERFALSGTKGVDRLVLPSRFQAAQLARSAAAPPMRVIPNGVDTQTFCPATPEERAQARDAFDVHGDPTVLYYGHLSPWKGAHTLVEALPRFFEECPGARLLLAHTSYGEGTTEVRNRLEELGVSSRVRLTGLADVPRLHAAADVAVLPPVAAVGTACYPNVLLECMAGGLPVVASRVGPIPEVVHDGVNGLLAAPGDPPSIARGLARLAADPSLRRQLAKNARTTMVERFTWPRIARQFERFYEELVADQPHPGRIEAPTPLGVEG